mgnify:CR=1 FL=1
MMHKSAFASARAQKVAQLPQPDVAEPGSEGARSLRALATDPHVIVLHGTLLSLVRRDGRDLTARQLTAFLTVYMDETTHTVSSLAEMLHVSRPGVTRIMDRLVQFDLVAREEDREDRRRVLVRRTTRGSAFFRDIVGLARHAAAEQDQGAILT